MHHLAEPAEIRLRRMFATPDELKAQSLERLVLEDQERLSAIKQMGVRLAIDDRAGRLSA